MPYCLRCGTRLPEDREARFCPNCGVPLSLYAVREEPGTAKSEAPKARKLGALSNRVFVMVGVILLCFAATAFGAASSVDPSDVQQINEDEERMRDALEYAGVSIVFGNNLMLCLIMFVPVLGPFFGSYVLYSTGRVIAAIGSASGMNPLVLFASLFVYPFAWLEYICYALAISESLWLVHAMTKNRLREEVTRAVKNIAICSILLLLAAFIEVLMIIALGS